MAVKPYKRTAAHKKKMSQILKDKFKDPEYRALRLSRSNPPKHYDDEGNEISLYEKYKDKVEAIKQTPECKAKQSKAAIKRWKRKKYRKKTVQSMKETMQKPENRFRFVEAVKNKKKVDKKFRKKMKKLTKNNTKKRKLHLIERGIKRVNDYCGVITKSDLETLDE